jgi:hypothetical protein
MPPTLKNGKICYIEIPATVPGTFFWNNSAYEPSVYYQTEVIPRRSNSFRMVW